MKQGTLVISNKLKPPHLRTELRRARLIALGYSEADKKLMTIIAGPGYGKTTLMAQIAECRLGDTMWYQVDNMDDDPMVFLRHIIYGMAEASGISAKRSKQRLEYIEDIESEGEQISELLCRELAEELSNPITICVDDCHLLKDSNTLHILATILENLPRDVYMVLSSRNSLALPLGKFRSAGALQEIRRQDLLFSHEEIRSLLEDVWGMTPSDDIIDQLLQRVGGWPAGLVLMESHIRANNSIPKLFTNHRIHTNIYGYLAEEALAGLDDDLRDVLMHCAPLDPVDPDIAGKVMGKTDVVDLLREAHSLNLFISNVDGTSSYRYHPLFKNFLLHVLGESKGSGYVSELQVRYGNELERAGDWAGAIEQYLGADRTDKAVPILEAHGSDMFRDGEYKTLGRWLKAIEPDDFTPALLLSFARIKMISGLTEDALEILTEAEPRIDNPTQRCECSLTIAECLGDLGNWMGGVDILQTVDATEINNDLTFEVFIQMSRLYFMGADFKRAREQAQLAQAAINDLFDKRKRNWVRYMLGMQNLSCGNFSKAYDHLNQYEALSEIHGNQRASHVNAIAYCLLLSAEYERAKEVATNSMRIVRQLNQKMWIAPVYDTLGSIEFGLGNHEKAIRLITEALENTIGKSRNAEAIAFCHKGSFLRWTGFYDDALEAHTNALNIAVEKGETYDEVMSRVNIAADLVYIEEYDKAKVILNVVEAMAEKFKFGYALNKIRYHRAWLAFKQNDLSNLTSNLTAYLKVANSHAQNHFLIQEGRITLELLSYALNEGIETNYLSWILSKVGVPSLPFVKEFLDHGDHRLRLTAVRIINSIGDPKGLTMLRKVARDSDYRVQDVARKTQKKLRERIATPEEHITKREMQVIEILNTGATNASIGKELFISEQTVKTHITNIMRKMGLNSRLEITLYYQEIIQKK